MDCHFLPPWESLWSGSDRLVQCTHTLSDVLKVEPTEDRFNAICRPFPVESSSKNKEHENSISICLYGDILSILMSHHSENNVINECEPTESVLMSDSHWRRMIHVSFMSIARRPNACTAFTEAKYHKRRLIPWRGVSVLFCEYKGGLSSRSGSSVTIQLWMSNPSLTWHLREKISCVSHLTTVLQNKFHFQTKGVLMVSVPSSTLYIN